MHGPDWFESLVGLPEGPPDEVRRRLVVDGARLLSLANGRSYGIGSLSTPSLSELRALAGAAASAGPRRLRVSLVRADVSDLHRDPANRHAVFQVASQFNLLEMTGPEVTPEHGVTRYCWDRTQGPACAIAAGAAVIFRNHVVEVDGQRGQSRDRQIDCLADLGAALGNGESALWTMANGYALCTRAGLARMAEQLGDAARRDALRGLLRVGVHRDIQVTITANPDQQVSHVLCSALPVAYSDVPSEHWAPFATLVLEAAYEATVWAGVLNAQRQGSPRLFLTELGGGAFGNDPRWIHAAMRRALEIAAAFDLDVRVVSYTTPSSALEHLVGAFA